MFTKRNILQTNIPLMQQLEKGNLCSDMDEILLVFIKPII